MKIDLSVIILTKNEEKNIVRCINSVKNIAKRILVIDSGSTDNTVNLAKELGADVFQHEFILYAKQFNWAIDNCNISTKWIMRLDADEALSDELVEEIRNKLNTQNELITGYVFRYKVIFLDRWIKHGGNYPTRKLALFRYGIGRIEDKEMDEHTIVSFGKVEEMKHDVIHYDFKNLTHWVDKHNWYATREKNDYFKQLSLTTIVGNNSNQIKKKRKKKSIYYEFPMFLRSLLLFIHRYFIKLGFLDGKEGLIYHFLQSFWYRFLVDSKIYEEMKIKKNE